MKIKAVQVFRNEFIIIVDDKGRVWKSYTGSKWEQLNLPDEPDTVEDIPFIPKPPLNF